MTTFRHQLFALCVAVFFPVFALAESPFSLVEIYKAPWPFGVSARSVSISDDGAYIACGWDEGATGHRDLWVYNVAADSWFQQTDLWADKEARLRREFSRELEEKRRAWDEDHPVEDGDSAEVDDCVDGEDTVGSTEAAEEEVFDAEELITEFEEELQKKREKFGGISQTLFGRESHELLYLYGGAIFSLNLDDTGATPLERLRHEAGFSSMSLADETADVLLISGSDLALWTPADGRLRQITSGGSGEKPNTSGYSLTPDATWLAHSSRDYRGKRKTKMAQFLTENPYMTDHNYIRPGDKPEGVSLSLLDLSVEPPWEIELELPDEPYYQVNTLDWSPIPGDLRLLVGVISGDTETFSVYIITPPVDDLADPEIELAYVEEDPAWINWARTSVAWDNTGQLLLHSEHQGLATIYQLVEVEPTEDAGESEELVATHMPGPALTSGEEVAWFQPLRQSARVAYGTDFGRPSAKGIKLLDLETNRAETLCGPDGWSGESFVVSQQENLAVFNIANTYNAANLAISSLDPSDLPGSPKLILDRIKPEWRAWSETWNVRFITVPTIDTADFENLEPSETDADAKDIHVKLHLPVDHDPARSYPLLIWLHGAGYSLSVKQDPGFYTLFHPYAAQELGWVVAEIDYRGSEGYGRDWRIDVADRLGHPETADMIAVKRHLVENYGADPERTALWGWSYGGFLTLMALGLAPGEFPVGCAVAPVNRWENYYYWYSTCRLDHPDDNPDAYDRSAAETYLEHISDDLLILHGLRDSNTLFQSIAQYLEEGHELGVNVELKLFPSDSHGMGNDFHYLRVYQGIVDYCEDHWPKQP